MSRSTLISFALCAVGSIALFGWMFSSEPIESAVGAKTANSGANQPIKKAPSAVVFAVPRSKATALNNLPVNIVIDPGGQKPPVYSGAADLIVTSSRLRMRSKPSSQSDTLANYDKGARFSHIRDENGWALVQSLDDGQQGWMFKKYMGKAG